MAKILNDAGLICIGAFVAPHEAVREKARRVVGAERFIEVFLTAPAEVLRQRDTTGAYKAADEGRIAQMPGVSAAFEAPKSPDLTIETDKVGVEEAVDRIVGLLRERGVVG